jgi:hypothetical protein
MNRKLSIVDLLRWRLAQAEAEAPPAPPAAHLLERAKPWWEKWPEQFRALVDRLGSVQLALGHALAVPRDLLGGNSVPALVVRGEEEIETSVRVLYLDVRNRCLRLRFQLEALLAPPEPILEVTFVSETAPGTPFSAAAVLVLDREYRLDTELAEESSRYWEKLKVTQRIPYRLILRPGAGG